MLIEDYEAALPWFERYRSLRKAVADVRAYQDRAKAVRVRLEVTGDGLHSATVFETAGEGRVALDLIEPALTVVALRLAGLGVYSEVKPPDLSEPVVAEAPKPVDVGASAGWEAYFLVDMTDPATNPLYFEGWGWGTRAKWTLFRQHAKRFDSEMAANAAGQTVLLHQPHLDLRVEREERRP